MRIRSIVVTLLAVAVGALAALPTAAHAQKIKRQRDLVSREELQASAQRDDNLYDALRSLRPRFLEAPPGVRSLGNAMITPTAVFIDGKHMGGLETLRTVVASTVDEARYLEPSRAGTEFGPVAGGGAVVVKLYKPKDKPKLVVKDDSVPAQKP